MLPKGLLDVFRNEIQRDNDLSGAFFLYTHLINYSINFMF